MRTCAVWLALQEAARTDSDEGDAVPVIRIHVRLDLEDEARERAIDGIDALPLALARNGPRRHVEETLEEGVDTEVGQRRAEEHRRLRALRDGLGIEFRARAFQEFEPLDDLIGEDPHRLAHGVVARFALDHVFRDAMCAVVAAGEGHEASLEEVVDAPEVAAIADGPIRRHDVHAEHFFDLGHDLERVPTVPIHLVHEGEDRDAAELADFAELSGLRLHAARCVDQHHGAVRRHQRPVGVLAEVTMARRVEDVDAVALELEVENGARHRDAALLLELEPIARGVSRSLLRAHGARFPHGAAVEQQLLRQRRLAGVRMRDDREGGEARVTCQQPSLRRAQWNTLRLCRVT